MIWRTIDGSSTKTTNRMNDMEDIWWPLAQTLGTLGFIGVCLALVICAGHIPWFNSLVGGAPIGGDHDAEEPQTR